MEHQNDIQQISAETSQLFSGAKIEWGRTKESIFSEKFESILAKPEVKVISFRQRVMQLSVAASLIVLVGLGTIALMYSKTVYSPAGSHLTAQLPDNSTVELNAESTLSFHPYRWYFQRNVELKGEGFFSVQKGKKFTVKSELGETSVLGTTFNIFSRNDTYRVFCKTGKVNVKANSGESVILNPNQIAIVESGKISKEENVISSEHILSWRDNMFLFNAAPIAVVLREIERQYGISIATEKSLSGTISLSIQKNPDVEKILSMVCKPLGYNFIKKSEKSYMITRNH
jgi:ferric-dicitrate binding protein FerR (iron transport regulator)